MTRTATIVNPTLLMGSLLWGATALAGPGGLPACMAGLSTCTSSLNTCDNSLSSCNSNLSVAQACGNGVIDSGEQCDQSNLNGQTCASQGFAAGVLKCGAGCTFNTSGCSANRFIDNGDGTVSDLQTGLMWEKKDNLDGDANYDDPHDAENLYTWSVTVPAYDVPTGTVFTDFLYKLNNCTFSFDGGYKGGFAGHCDWRLPTKQELQGIIDLNAPGCATNGCNSNNGVLPYSPCIDPAFGPTNVRSIVPQRCRRNLLDHYESRDDSRHCRGVGLQHWVSSRRLLLRAEQVQRCERPRCTQFQLISTFYHPSHTLGIQWT